MFSIFKCRHISADKRWLFLSADAKVKTLDLSLAQRGKRGGYVSKKRGPQIQKKNFGWKYITIEEECHWFRCSRCLGLRFMIVGISGVVKKRVYPVPCAPELKNALSQAILHENGYGFFCHLTHFKGKVQGQKSAQKSTLVLSECHVLSQKYSKITAYLVLFSSDLFLNHEGVDETTSGLSSHALLTCMPNLVHPFLV